MFSLLNIKLSGVVLDKLISETIHLQNHINFIQVLENFERHTVFGYLDKLRIENVF